MKTITCSVSHLYFWGGGGGLGWVKMNRAVKHAYYTKDTCTCFKYKEIFFFSAIMKVDPDIH